MKYDEFREKAGMLSDSREFPSIMRVKNGVSVLVDLGVTLEENDFRAFEVGIGHEQVLDCIKSLEARGAKREQDYILCLYQKGPVIVLGLHATEEYVSPEDFPNARHGDI